LQHQRSELRLGKPVPENARNGVKSVDCRGIVRRKEDDAGPLRDLVASYDSAGQSKKMASFTYVYVLRSEANPKRFYTGRTVDLRERLTRHNSGKVPHTAKWRPWRIKTYIAFSDAVRALEFERYLKSSSGRAFLKKASLDLPLRNAAGAKTCRAQVRRRSMKPDLY
jgi:putative endonuclease